MGKCHGAGLCRPGPQGRNYKQFLPPHTFIHLHNFQSRKELALYVLVLDKDHARFLSYFAGGGHCGLGPSAGP